MVEFQWGGFATNGATHPSFMYILPVDICRVHYNIIQPVTFKTNPNFKIKYFFGGWTGRREVSCLYFGPFFNLRYTFSKKGPLGVFRGCVGVKGGSNDPNIQQLWIWIEHFSNFFL